MNTNDRTSRQDEVALGQTVNLVRPGGNHNFSPGQQQIRMMALFLGHRADLVDVRQCLREIRESVGLLEMMFFHHFPAGNLPDQRLQRGATKWRDSTTARNTVLCG